MTLVLAETRRNASVCGCSSMAEQKLPKLLAFAEICAPISKTRRETGLSFQRLGIHRQNILAPARLPANEGRQAIIGGSNGWS